MTDIIDVNVIVDEKYVDPKIDIYTNNRNEMIDEIILAIENVSKNSFPAIPVQDDGKLKFVAQREIYRIRTEGRSVILDTADGSYPVKGTISKFEDSLDEDRFFRISRSEIINLYKVKNFDFHIAGTVGVEFDNGTRAWVSRRSIKPLREKLKKSLGGEAKEGKQ